MNIEDIQKLYNQLNPTNKTKGTGNQEESDFLKLEVGTTVVRILPNINQENPLFTKRDMHKVTNAEGGDSYFTCFKLFDENCPICDTYFTLYKIHNLLAQEAGVDSKKFESFPKQIAKSLKKWERYLMNVLVRETGEIKILDAGSKLAGKIVGFMMDEEVGDITDLKTGIDLKIEKKIVLDYPNYDDSTLKRDRSPVASSKSEIEDILAKRHNLDALVVKADYTEVKAAADLILANFKDDLSRVEIRKNPTSKSPFLNKLEG